MAVQLKGGRKNEEREISLETGNRPAPPLTSAYDLLRWYEIHLCEVTLTDPRGNRVVFTCNKFVHFAKLKDRYGTEPKNRERTIGEIRRGRFHLRGGTPNFDPIRVRNLALAADLVRQPDYIVPNWQVLGRANPGEVYMRDFGSNGRRAYMALVCGFAGKQRLAVTIFNKRAIEERILTTKIWP